MAYHLNTFIRIILGWSSKKERKLIFKFILPAGPENQSISTKIKMILAILGEHGIQCHCIGIVGLLRDWRIEPLFLMIGVIACTFLESH